MPHSFLAALSFLGHVHLPGDHDPLGLGRTGAVHGFGQIAHGGRAQGQVFDQPQDAHAGSRSAHRSWAAKYFLEPFAGFRGLEVRFRGQGHHQPAGNVLGQPRDFIGKPGDVLLVDIGQQGVDRNRCRWVPGGLRRRRRCSRSKGFR